jgi:ribosomal protein RSM22 (predicted rRNA methylase)
MLCCSNPSADANRKSVKRRGTELTQRLRHMSRSKHRGGVHPNLTQQLAADDAEEETAAAAKRWQRRGKRRQTRNHFLDQLTRTPAMPVDVEQRSPPQLSEVLASLQGAVTAEEAAQAAAGREQSASRNSIADGGSLYDTPAALAYAASRMPACYAALEASLREVAARRPSWHPQNMLDFGAGPGTAVWAAQQVWRQQPLDALAVEPAGAMSWLGSEIQQRQLDRYDAAMQQGQGQGQQQFAGGAGAAAATAGTQQPEEEEGDEDEEPPAPPPRLRWMYKLPPRYRTASAVRQYDLVTAGYVLGELAGDVERRRLVADLWDRTADGGVLLLVEPGTPSGSGHVQKARAQLLEAAHQQAQQAQQVQGAHVVAPCPHDGACPLESRPSWCHFVQRFQVGEGAAAASRGLRSSVRLT